MHDVTVDTERDEGFEDLYRRIGGRLWRSLLLYAGDPEVASDAVAEAFAQAIRRGEALTSAQAWITKAAFKIAAGDLKSRRIRLSAPVPERGYEMPEPALELANALAQLSEKQRAAAVLHFQMGYTLAEVASIIGSTPNAVGVHLNRARTRLRALLGDDDA
jgi:RNA polymerase sigma-70 factor (ECF subfamily)